MEENLTPAMQQYWRIKKQWPDCILFFRMGDFYESFYDDAKIVARVLQIVLTARGKGSKKAPLAGIPYHALDTYLHKLIKAGHKVAIVEQLEDPKTAKGIVKRGVVRIVTPGTVTEDILLELGQNNYIMTFNPVDSKNKAAVAICDFSTGQFYVAQINNEEVWDEIERFSPKEVILPDTQKGSKTADQLQKKGVQVNYVSESYYWYDNAEKVLLDHFKVYSLDALGVKDKNIISCAGALIKYFYDTQFRSIAHITRLCSYDPHQKMVVDETTLRNLELVKNLSDGSTKNTLLSVLNKTVTPMGSRNLRAWLVSPLINRQEIKKRLDAVNYLVKNYRLREELREVLKKTYDIHRIASRIGMGTVMPKELVSLTLSLETVSAIKKLLRSDADKPEEMTEEIKNIAKMNELKDIVILIKNAIADDPASTMRDGGVIRKGFSADLDELKKVVDNSREWLAGLEQKERARCGIKKLRIGYNKVMGYYIEIPRAQAIKAPVDYIRKQTQKNSERFITSELKEKEAVILTAHERIVEKETQLYMQIIEKIKEKIPELQDIAEIIGKLDTYVCFAVAAHENQYVKPVIISDNIIKIKDGRHPVVEKMVDSFVPNNVHFSNAQKVMIITGPNMSGKSTVIRQTALIIMMAQAGSFVPASSAEIGVVDRVFTRVGARDDIARGQSTFMMEMVETANILNNATDRSFAVLDEIGRGTSTYDGMSLAWAIIEYMHKNIGCKIMFATHYHLLNLLSLKYNEIVNYNISVNESGGEVVFLHKLMPGGTDKSYGVHVAKLAGMPKQVILRSMEIASVLEQSDHVHRETLSNLTLNLFKDDEDENEKIMRLEKQFNITLEKEHDTEKELDKRNKKMKQTTLQIFEGE
jgi:DNA mismatch repair protein MutS